MARTPSPKPFNNHDRAKLYNIDEVKAQKVTVNDHSKYSRKEK